MEEDELKKKSVDEISPDTLEAVFAEEIIITEDEEELVPKDLDDEEDDEVDIAFKADDEDYW